MADVPDFRLGIRVADAGGTGGFGIEQFTGYARLGDQISPWAGDSNNYDPDAARITLETHTVYRLTGVDFRVGMQARDKGNYYGTIEYTPWASDGGGKSDLATDNNGYDPDQYRLFIDTRPLAPGDVINDFRVSLQAYDRRDSDFGIPVYTPWASQGGGRSNYALDQNGYDLDGFVIGLDVR